MQSLGCHRTLPLCIFETMQLLIKYLKLWWIFTVRTAQIAFESRLGILIFTLGKLLRFGFHSLFIFIILKESRVLAGYNILEIFLFFAVFNLIDSLAQFMLREVYRFRRQIVSGYFDYVLSWPINPLFKSLFAGADLLDLPMIFISGSIVVFILTQLDFSGLNLLLFMLFVLNALIIALAFHISVLSLGVITTEVDNTLWIYRDFLQMARLPVDIYREPLKTLITFIIPVSIMVTIPVKALLGLLSVEIMIISFGIGLTFLAGSLYFWKIALRHYSSASS